MHLLYSESGREELDVHPVMHTTGYDLECVSHAKNVSKHHQVRGADAGSRALETLEHSASLQGLHAG